LHIPHIPDSNLFHIVCQAELNNLTASFMQNISLLAVQLCAGSGFAFQQSAVAFRSGFAARDQGVERGMTLVTQAFD